MILREIKEDINSLLNKFQKVADKYLNEIRKSMEDMNMEVKGG